MGYFTLVMLCVFMFAINMKVEGKTSLEDRIKSLENQITTLKSTERSSMKKLKKQIKREVRHKLVSKVLKSVNKTIDGMVKKKLDAAVDEIDLNSKTSSADTLVMFNHIQVRMKLVEEENIALKKALVRTSEKSKKDFVQLQERLSDDCNCHLSIVVNSTEIPPAPTMPAFRLPKMLPERASVSPVHVPYSGVVNASHLKDHTPEISIVDLREDRTFNISSGMPDFTDQDSLLLVDDEGNMTRVSLSNPAVRGKMKTESYVEGITYDPVSRKIFWGSNRAQHKAIYSVGLDGSDLTKLQDGKWAFSLAVDGRRRKLFISDWSQKVVCVMSTNGHNYKIIADYNDDGDPRNIVLDTQRRLLYVSYSFSIVKMKYDGSRIKRLAEGIWMQPLTADLARNILYYSVRRNIYQLDLSGSRKSAKFMNQLDLDLSTIVFHKNKLYIGYQSWVPPVDVLDLKANALTRFADVQGDSVLRMCLIPAA